MNNCGFSCLICIKYIYCINTEAKIYLGLISSSFRIQSIWFAIKHPNKNVEIDYRFASLSDGK